MSSQSPESENTSRLRAVVAEQMEQTVSDLASLVRIPSCAFPGYPREPVDAAAHRTVELLRSAGATDVQLVGDDVNPAAVYAEVPGPEDAPTVLLYAHYDVQPIGDEQAWDSPPFEPEVRDGRMYGRGAADDKSGVMLHVAALRAFDGRPPCNVRVIIEGDEEYGGSFESFPRSHPEMFDADAILIADSGNLNTGEPSLTTALRGMTSVLVSVRTLEAPVHSGLFGGPAPDALMALITVLSSLRDENGDTTIAGVDSGEWGGSGTSETEFREQAGVLQDQPLLGTGSISSRLITKPAASVVGMDVPSIEGAINSVVPQARAIVSLRIPPQTDPEQAVRALTEHLLAHAPWGVQVEVQPEQKGRGFSADTRGPAYRAMREALRQSYGIDAVEIGSGGSIPLVATLTEVVPDADILIYGAQDTAANIHAPNESLDLGELEHSIVSEVLFLQLLAESRADVR